MGIRFGNLTMYPDEPSDAQLVRAAEYLAGSEVVIGIDLGISAGAFTVYGCDLTEGYVRTNADYTT